ncbi:MAG: glycosyltransferase family 2 protein [Anaerolineaceae bacterium]|nr:glycosyltransferase family 2 protein [Anaerolineaceae bacterium]
MDVSIVLLNWNGAEDTIACLRPMLDWRQVRPSLIVVDNASAGDDVAQIRQALPCVCLVENGRNEGFSGGSNRGMEFALAQGDAPILLLNNDAVIGETAVRRLVQTLEENPQIGMVVPQLLDEHGKLVAVGSKNPAFHIQTRVQSFPDDAPVQLVETISGTAVLIRAAMLRQVGLLDERFFFSTEMADLSLRARRHGFVCAVDRRAEASHTISRSAPLRSSLYVYYIVRNRLLFLRSHYRWRFDLRAFWLAYTLALALKLRLGGQPVTAKAVWLALGDGVNGRFGGQNERVLAYCTGEATA